MISKFLQATIARNAPLLDPEQVAAIMNIDLALLDAHVRKNTEEEQADFGLKLRLWNEEMESYIALKDINRCSPCLREYLHDNLCVDARMLPVGERLPLPQSSGPKLRSVEEAMEVFFGKSKNE